MGRPKSKWKDHFTSQSWNGFQSTQGEYEKYSTYHQNLITNVFVSLQVSTYRPLQRAKKRPEQLK